MSATAISLKNPFPGLRPYWESEAELFFGQDEQIDALMERLGRARFVAVLGLSGCGKSSLVRAGLLGELHRCPAGAKNWRVALFRPGAAPVRNLAASLTAALPLDMGAEEAEARLRRNCLGVVELVRESGLGRDQRVLLVVDQFEELFRFWRDDQTGPRERDEAALFVKLLLAAAENGSGTYVVTTMRSDFLGDCSLFYGLAETVNQGMFLLPKMSRDECEEVITGPVQLRGAQIDPSLVQRLLNETEEQEDGLPLLQHALMRIWQRWVERGSGEGPISNADFDRQPGTDGRRDSGYVRAAKSVAGELDEHLDSILNELSAEQRKIAERLFQLLSERDSKGRLLRRGQTLPQLVEAIGEERRSDLLAVIEAFRDEGRGRTFLTPGKGEPLDGSPIDIAHECLLRRWRRLRGWVVQEARKAEEFRLLCDEADTAELRGAAEVLTGGRLDRFLEWRERYQPDERWARRYQGGYDQNLRRNRCDYHAALAFLDRSEKKRAEDERRESEKRQARIQAATRRMRVSTSVAVLLFALGGYAAYSARVAERARETAVNEQTRALELRKVADKAAQEALHATGKAQVQARELAEASRKLQGSWEREKRLLARERNAYKTIQHAQAELQETYRELKESSDKLSVTTDRLQEANKELVEEKGKLSKKQEDLVATNERLVRAETEAKQRSHADEARYLAASAKAASNPSLGVRLALTALEKVRGTAEQQRLPAVSQSAARDSLDALSLALSRTLRVEERFLGSSIRAATYDEQRKRLTGVAVVRETAGAHTRSVVRLFPSNRELRWPEGRTPLPILTPFQERNQPTVELAAISSDGERVALVTDKGLVVTNAAGSLSRRVKVKGGAPESIAFNRTGSTLFALTGSEGWQLFDGGSLEVIGRGKDAKRVTSMAVSGNRQWVTYASVGGEVVRARLHLANKSVFPAELLQSPVSPPGKPVPLDVADDGSVAAGLAKGVKVYAGGAVEGKPSNSLGESIVSVAFSPDQSLLAVLADRTLYVLRTRDPRMEELRIPELPQNPLSVRFTASGKLLTVMHEGGRVQVWALHHPKDGDRDNLKPLLHAIANARGTVEVEVLAGIGVQAEKYGPQLNKDQRNLYLRQ